MSDLEGNFPLRQPQVRRDYRLPERGTDRQKLFGMNILSENSMNKAAQLLQANMEGKSTGPDEIELISKEGTLHTR